LNCLHVIKDLLSREQARTIDQALFSLPEAQQHGVQLLDSTSFALSGPIHNAFVVLIKHLPLDHRLDQVSGWDSHDKIKATMDSIKENLTGEQTAEVAAALKMLKTRLPDDFIQEMQEILKMPSWKDEQAMEKVHDALEVIIKHVPDDHVGEIDSWHSIKQIEDDLGEQAAKVASELAVLRVNLPDADVAEVLHILRNKAPQALESGYLAAVPTKKRRGPSGSEGGASSKVTMFSPAQGGSSASKPASAEARTPEATKGEHPEATKGEHLSGGSRP
jgi:hypothetical protein